MSEATEIAEKISKHIQDLYNKGQRFIRIPLWADFASHLAYYNRFGKSETKDVVCNFISHLISKKRYTYQLHQGDRLFRSRIISNKEVNLKNLNPDGTVMGYNEVFSGMPKSRVAGIGRVNTPGIPVLYTATEPETSCAEVRPTKHQLISIAQYQLNQDVTVANFVLDNISDKDGDIEAYLFLNEMFRSFSAPVSIELIDYLPSEFIAEYIRINHKEISGIRYTSLQNEGGYNIALFDDKICSFIQSEVVECNKVKYDYVSLSHNEDT